MQGKAWHLGKAKAMQGTWARQGKARHLGKAREGT
jgi:hypothetical protein